MPLYGDFCVRLQNAARARIRSVPLPHTADNLSMSSILLQHGFIHNVTRGTAAGPSPTAWRTAPISARRLWVDLKYGSDDRPVLEQMQLVSKPSRKMSLTNEELLRFATGTRANFIPPLRLGEIGIVKCGAHGWWEVRDAIKQGLGGEVVCRVS
ncbi:hypothetical protein CF319_g2292 [Tilletia indica]|uniref:Ribosomal protein S8 n=1 Tax=Tilletia walkeri TaxID=117179 RepID=A0A8X7T8G5_9BASI|nr:hypothetical protein CF327_g1654 [Tilletia walkeri]KAE8224873.1 hypothetical protein CF319_g2292 [Tilletia indica]KAE8234855.1 hypothetical protein CF326_g112 [Tilletia indica]KAE8271323.1 hypothetical protein A4X09_0g1017 [Tilletia walkeri]